ncbi:MAG: DUF3082 domain-containing protein [Cyanobacteria bacterium J06649_4]
MENSTSSADASQPLLDLEGELDGKPTDEVLLADGQTPATPLRCFAGAMTSAGFSLLAYRLTLSIAASFAGNPITSDKPAVVNISAAVRTLVMGIVALGAGVFGVAALGLAGLGIQLLLKKKD